MRHELEAELQWKIGEARTIWNATKVHDRGRGGTTRGCGRREIRTGAVRGVNEARVSGSGDMLYREKFLE